MELVFDGFDWDHGNLSKCTAHGVSFAEIEAMFLSGSRITSDPEHSLHEDRLIAIGRNYEGRSLFVAFTVRLRGERRLIRPISARYMHSREIRRYDANGP